MIGETGRLVREVAPLGVKPETTIYDIDKTYIRHDRLVNKTYGKQAAAQRNELTYRTVDVVVAQPSDDTLYRNLDAKTHIPKNQEEFDARCEYMFRIMANGVAQAVTEGRTFSLELALSGGLDSTLAALTLVYTCELLGKDPSFIQTIGKQ
jgi:NAD+ synthase (glutamine-hydrolysing)